MFNRHVYTCPDVIHDRKVARRNGFIAIGVNLIFLGGLAIWGKQAERAIENEIDEHENTNA